MRQVWRRKPGKIMSKLSQYRDQSSNPRDRYALAHISHASRAAVAFLPRFDETDLPPPPKFVIARAAICLRKFCGNPNTHTIKNREARKRFRAGFASWGVELS
jgi:hypothetical protein